MSEIVVAAGGRWVDRLPAACDDKLILVSCPEDKRQLGAAAKKASAIPVQTKEVLLTGLLRRELDFKKNTL